MNGCVGGWAVGGKVGRRVGWTLLYRSPCFEDREAVEVESQSQAHARALLVGTSLRNQPARPLPPCALQQGGDGGGRDRGANHGSSLLRPLGCVERPGSWRNTTPPARLPPPAASCARPAPAPGRAASPSALPTLRAPLCSPPSLAASQPKPACSVSRRRRPPPPPPPPPSPARPSLTCSHGLSV